MAKATHLIKIWLVDSFPKNYTDQVIRGMMLERFHFLGDKLENIEVIPLEKMEEKQKEEERNLNHSHFCDRVAGVTSRKEKGGIKWKN